MTTGPQARALSGTSGTHTYEENRGPENRVVDRDPHGSATSMTLPHYAWHEEADGGWTYLIALDVDGRVLSAYVAQKRVPPGTRNLYDALTNLELLTADLKAGGWHPMGGRPYELPPSIAEEGDLDAR